MDIWEAKCLALAATIKDEASIDKAEKFVNSAIKVRVASGLPLSDIVYIMLTAIDRIERVSIKELKSVIEGLEKLKG